MKTKLLKSKEINSLLYEINFSSKEVKLSETIYGTTPTIEDGGPEGGPGEPALPARIVRIALPLNCKYSGFDVNIAKPVQLSKKTFIAPIQPAQVGAKMQQVKFSLKDQLKKIPRTKVNKELLSKKNLSLLMKPEFKEERVKLETRHYLPDTKGYTAVLNKPAPIVSFVREENYGLQRVVVLKLKPVEWRRDLSLWLHQSINISVSYEFVTRDPSESLVSRVKKSSRKKQQDLKQELMPSITSRFSSANQVRRVQDMISSIVINPSLVADLSRIWPRYFGPAEYLVITDNNRWDAQTITVSGAVAGNIVAEFQRLVSWKRQKGMTARVVTVSDIVEGRFGNFRTGSRDLQEVIRKFLKWAYNNWSLCWVLIGGDIEIVPVREIAGNLCGDFEAVTDTKPAAGKMKRETGYVKMNVTGWNIMTTGNTLLNHDTGAAITYDAAGIALTGWYFTTNDNYNVRSTTQTNFVRVNAPAATVNARLRWIRYENSIPTDLYYSNLTAEVPGGHDWDSNNNQLYGQAVGSGDIDSVTYTADVSVGRAPVDNATDAATFVNKVLAYEQLRDPVTKAAHDTTWLRKFLYLSSNWGGTLGIGPKPGGTALANNQYEFINSINRTVIQLENPLSNSDWRLLSAMPGNVVVDVPYNPDAANTIATGWYYANSPDYTVASEFRFSIPIFGIDIRFPIPTRWVVVKSSPGIMQPAFFVFNQFQLDGSAADQEQLRNQVTTAFTHYSMVDRLYEDLLDLSPAQIAAAPVQRLTETDLVNRINGGQHFISMSGHGNWGGCCGFSPTIGQNATNGYQTFIGYADSCLTNEFNVTDAISETLIKNSNGGAVAYIGNTRYSWIGVGDNFQRQFFNRLRTTSHLGLALDVKSTMLNEPTGFWSDYNNWTIFSLNLAGDPEMQVWKSEPALLRVRHPLFVGQTARTITVRVSDSNTGGPVNEAVVSIVTNDRVITQSNTNTTGAATLPLTGVVGESFEIIVVKENFRPAFSEARYLSFIRNLDNVIIRNFSFDRNKKGKLAIDQNDPATGKTVSETVMVETDMLKDKVLVKALNKYKTQKTPLSIGINEETHTLTEIELS